jgi:very-short-patch-repair endonuclease
MVSDKERKSILESFGMKFVRIPDREVKQNLNGVMQYLENRVFKLVK